MISVAAELTGLHPQTLRQYDRVGLVSPGRTGGGGRRYSLQRHRAAARGRRAHRGRHRPRGRHAGSSSSRTRSPRCAPATPSCATGSPSSQAALEPTLAALQERRPNLPALRPPGTLSPFAATCADRESPVARAGHLSDRRDAQPLVSATARGSGPRTGDDDGAGDRLVLPATSTGCTSLSIPVFTGVVGWLINWTGLIMLFSPVRFHGVTVPGMRQLSRGAAAQAPGGARASSRAASAGRGSCPARAAKMGSIAVDKAIAKLGTPAEFYQQLEPDQIAEHIVAGLPARDAAA